MRLRAIDLHRGKKKLGGVSLEVRAGEILALTGLVGAGRAETARLLFGADRIEGGEIELDGEPVHLKGREMRLKTEFVC